MKARVINGFVTPLRRFRVGQLIDEAEIDGPFDMVSLIERGFLSPGEADLPPPPMEELVKPEAGEIIQRPAEMIVGDQPIDHAAATVVRAADGRVVRRSVPRQDSEAEIPETPAAPATPAEQ